MEIWDAYDALCRKTGETLVRGECIPSGLYHLAVHVVLRHADGTFLQTRRDLQKTPYPGYWELGAGGSAVRGEDALEGARRELFEETGMTADTLKCNHHILSPRTQTIYIGFVGSCSGDKDAVRLQAGETIDYRWISAKELLAFYASGACIPGEKQRWKLFLHQLEEETK